MITGAHFMIYSANADADRAFIRDILGFKSIDVGGGWLIFKAPPSELAVHPAEASGMEMYLMCDDLDAEVKKLNGQGVQCTDVQRQDWGAATSFALPSGARVGLYQPTHPTAL